MKAIKITNYRLYSTFIIGLSFFLFSCNRTHVHHEKDRIQIFTILNCVKTNEITNSIANSNNIIHEIKKQYENSKIIKKNIPLQQKNYIDLHTVNFPNLAKAAEWEEIKYKSKEAITYLKWDVSSDVDTVVYFLCSSDYDYSLWVNRSLISSEKGKKSTPYYQKSKKINLRKGINRFVVELVKNKRCATNCFNFSILSTNDAANELIHRLNVQYLSKLVLKKEDSLYINAQVLKDIIPKYQYSILNKGDTIFSSTTSNFYQRIPSEIFKNKNDSYSCVLSCGEYNIRQPFVVGSIDAVYKELLADSNIVTTKSLSPYFYRLKKLMALKDRNYWWPHKVTLILEKISDPVYRDMGVSLHSFNSVIDSSKQHYIAITPEEINNGQKYPVIIMFRPALKYKTHLLTSIHLHRVQALNYLVSLCNSKGYIMLISSNRSYYNENLSPMAETDIVESLSDLRSKYSIDNNRIFLFGSCLGAKKALQFVENQEINYAGLALYNPALNPTQKFNFERLRYIPMYLHHDIYDEHTPIGSSESLIEKAKRHGVYIQSNFDNYFRNSYFYFFIDQDVFSFFEEIKSTNLYRKHTPSNEEITIKNIFANNFRVVYGTKTRSSALKNISDTLTKQWEKYFYAPCISSADTSEMLRNDTISNLLLIGGEANNWLTDSLMAKEDLNWISEEIKEFTDQMKKRDPTYEFLFKHKNRLFLIIGTTDNNNLKYDFRYQPWFYADYKRKISYSLYN